MRKYATLIFTLLLVSTSFFSSANAQDDPIRVGSKSFTEQIILGQIILSVLDDAGFAVEDRTALGGTQVSRQSLVNGEIDVYAEYTGTALFNNFSDIEWVNVPQEAYSDRTLGFAMVSTYDAAIFDLIWLETNTSKQHLCFCGKE